LGEEAQVTKETLYELGFQFRYCTHVLETNSGSGYYCYEYGYIKKDDENIILTKYCFTTAAGAVIGHLK
jgi:hypothetical protein